MTHWHTGLPSLEASVKSEEIDVTFHLLTVHWVLGPQGLGKQGSGGGVLASILEQPVMVSGWGSKPGRHVHTGLPCLLGLHSVLGPQGEGSQGSGLGAHLVLHCHVTCYMCCDIILSCYM